jgi:hypothetical protein
MASTVTSDETPARPGHTAPRAGPPPRRPARGPGRNIALRRLLVVVLGLLFLLVVAVWKPWETGSGGTGRSTIPPGAAGSLLPAITSDPGSKASPGGS